MQFRVQNFILFRLETCYFIMKYSFLFSILLNFQSFTWVNEFHSEIFLHTISLGVHTLNKHC